MQNVCFSDEELTDNINGDESTLRNCEEEIGKTDSEIHTPTNIQEHKVQNFRKRQNFLKGACSKGSYSYTCIGKSLHNQTQQSTVLHRISKLSYLLVFSHSLGYKIISSIFFRWFYYKALLESLLVFRYILVIFLPVTSNLLH